MPDSQTAPAGVSAIVQSVGMSCAREDAAHTYQGTVNGDMISFTQHIPYISLRLNGEDADRLVYCIDLFSPEYPGVGMAYRTAPLLQSGAPLSPAQAEKISALLLNGYPEVDARTFFERAGVDVSQQPQLTEKDAAAVMQMVLWGVQAQGNVSFEFLDCDAQSLHPKHGRLSAACGYYYANMPLSKGQMIAFEHKQPMVLPDASGAYRVGPIRLWSGRPDADVRLVMQPRVDGASLLDTQGNPVTGPKPDEPFFIKIPAAAAVPGMYHLHAQLYGETRQAVAFVHQELAKHPDMQPLGGVLHMPAQLLGSDSASFEIKLSYPATPSQSGSLPPHAASQEGTLSPLEIPPAFAQHYSDPDVKNHHHPRMDGAHGANADAYRSSGISASLHHPLGALGYNATGFSGATERLQGPQPAAGGADGLQATEQVPRNTGGVAAPRNAAAQSEQYVPASGQRYTDGADGVRATAQVPRNAAAQPGLQHVPVNAQSYTVGTEGMRTATQVPRNAGGAAAPPQTALAHRRADAQGNPMEQRNTRGRRVEPSGRGRGLFSGVRRQKLPRGR